MALKYGFLVSTPYPAKKEKFINLGDDIQSQAVMNLYNMMGISPDQIIPIDFNELVSYKGEYIVLPICYNLQTDYDLIPFSQKIIPVFIGLSLFETSKLTQQVIEYLKKYEPIGCRDEQTFRMLSSVGISAYLAGCITQTFPLRKKSESQNKIFLVDVPDDMEKLIPQNILRGGVRLSH